MEPPVTEAPPPEFLAADEPSPVTAEGVDGASPFLLVCDHAGRLLPRRLGSLGLPDSDIARHIGWDIGIEATSRLLAKRLDAPLICQNYSRLVIDCNRDPRVDSSIPEISETTIPGNLDLGEEERRLRREAIFEPYHAQIAASLDRRARSGKATVLVAMHSFTPVFKGLVRPWHAGLLYNRDRRLAEILLDLLAREGDLVIGDNEPYSVSDLTDFTIPVHGEKRGLPHVEIEIRQDLIADAEGQAAWAERLSRLLPLSLARFEATYPSAKDAP
jgi:predicted N-formylglutamate amidohydrolase